MYKYSLLILITLLGSTMGTTGCVNKNPGTETGNPNNPIDIGHPPVGQQPQVTVAYNLTTAICNKINFCLSQDKEICRAKVLVQESIPIELNLNSYLNLEAIRTDELASKLNLNSTMIEQCLNSLNNLLCNSPNFSANIIDGDYSQVHLFFRESLSCSQIYTLR